MSGKRNRRVVTFRLVGLVLVCVGIWQIASAVGSSGRDGFGRFFFDDEEVAALILDAGKHNAAHVDACKDEKIAARFDSSSRKKLERWCNAVSRFEEEGSADSAIALLRARNLLFARISNKLFAAGGELARKSLALEEADCSMSPYLERVANQAAGAALSQFLIGLFLLIGGALAAVSSWRNR